MGKDGDVVGVVGVDPPHLRKEKPPSKFEELYVDAGFSSRDEALKNGIVPGTQVHLQVVLGRGGVLWLLGRHLIIGLVVPF